MSLCENHQHCGFFEKHGSKEAAVFAMLANIYCCGPLQDECARKRIMVETGHLPSDDLAPTGLNFSNG